MPITREQLGDRLERARKAAGLTQQGAADALGIVRTAVVQMEAGNRTVTSLELSQLARQYKKDLDYFLADEEPIENPVALLLRAAGDFGPEVQKVLEHCASLCQDATELERGIGLSLQPSLVSDYPLDPPASRWDAIEQGALLATMERRRLELGTQPARNLVEIIRRQGVRATKHRLPDNISGVFFLSEETGMAIIVNSEHAPTRRLFSYAHEYGHLLVDRGQMQNISQLGNRSELTEIRANAFAAHFLMPEEGIRSYLGSLGRGGTSRQVQTIYDGFLEALFMGEEDAITAQRRAQPGTQEIQWLDALRLSMYFGTSYEASLYQLLNLKIINKERLEALLNHRDQADEARQKIEVLLSETFGTPVRSLPEERGDLNNVLFELAIDARCRSLITAGRLREIMNRIGVDYQKLAFLFPTDVNEQAYIGK